MIAPMLSCPLFNEQQKKSVAIIGVLRILQWRGFTWRGAGPAGLGDEVPQKLKQNVKIVYIFNVFLYKI